MHIGSIAVVTSVLLAASMPAAEGANQPMYTVGETITLGAPARWDYVGFDPASHRVYVAHGDRVSVVDGRSGAVVGAVRGMPGGTHGIGISTATGQGFTDDGKAGLAIPFDLTTFARKPPIKVGADADGIVVDPMSGHVFVVGGDPGTLSVLDPKTDAVIATIDGGGKLEFAVADDRGHVYVDGKARNEIVRVDTRSDQVDARWPMPDCVGPHGLAIDQVTHRLFAGCSNKVLTVVNADTGAVVANVPIGAGNDGVAFDPKRKLVLSANGRDGTLTVIREGTDDSFVLHETVATAPGARTLAIDPESGRVFLAAAEPTSTNDGSGTARRAAVRLIVLDPAK